MKRLVVLSILALGIFCDEKDTPTGANKNETTPVCLVGTWVQKTPDTTFTQKIEYKADYTGVHFVSADQTRDFTWKMDTQRPVVTYSDNNEQYTASVSCVSPVSLYQKDAFIKEGSSTDTGDGGGDGRIANMKVQVNGGQDIDVYATVDCAVIGGKKQFMIIGQGEGIVMSLNFRDITVAVNTYDLFININDDVNRFVGVEWAYNSNAGVIRYRADYPECCGSGSIIITERTASVVKGTFSAVTGASDGPIQFTGEFEVAITDNDCD